MSDIYCGINKIPKGKRLGTMQECLEAKKVNYYGIKRIDPVLLENYTKLKKTPGKNIDKLKVRIQEIRGKLTKLKKEMDKEKDKDKKKELKIKYKELYAEGVVNTKLMNELEKTKNKK